jgi:hypothetical protein
MTVLIGCSASCHNVAYDVDLSQPGASSPIAAIDPWRDDGSQGMPSPPDGGWDVPQDDEQAELTLLSSDGDGVVDVMRTDDGGWVVVSEKAHCSWLLQAMVMPPSTAMVWPVT